jgi:hypothetical protein
MKNITEPKILDEVVKRIENVTGSDKALWGKMNAHEMFCHTADQIRLTTGEKTSPFRGNAATKTIVKKLILWGMPAPKGKVETTKELKQGAGGTKPGNFSEDKQALISLLSDFTNSFEEKKKVEHPAFGNMNKAQWGRLIYVHMDHHLRQFGK